MLNCRHDIRESIEDVNELFCIHCETLKRYLTEDVCEDGAEHEFLPIRLPWFYCSVCGKVYTDA